MIDHWTEDDFDKVGWHDVHVHGLRIVEGEHGSGHLCFEIDYILDWICPKDDDKSYRFKIAPALLNFRNVTSLRLSVDYATPTAALGPFSIDGIERQPIAYSSDYNSFRWTIPVNWPDGRVEFESPGFTLKLTGPAVETDAQYLKRDEL